MLKKKERLTKQEFDRFFSIGRRRHGPLFTLIFNQSPAFHGAVVVGKKVHQRAVDRNRLRRRLYSILYRVSRDHDLRGVYIILTRPAAAGAKFADLKACLEQLIVLPTKN